MKTITESVKVVASLPLSPGNITLTPDNRIFCSLHQFYNPKFPVAEVVGGRLEPLSPSPKSQNITFASVLGIRADASGHLWILDNGNQSKSLPKLVAWDIRQNQLAKVIYLPPPITLSDSFVNDLAIELSRNVVYISDPIAGAGSALIRVDIKTGLATRILQGYQSVIPEDIDLRQSKTQLDKIILLYTYGSQDPYFNLKNKESLFQIISNNELNITITSYSGVHKIDRKYLHDLFTAKIKE